MSKEAEEGIEGLEPKELLRAAIDPETDDAAAAERRAEEERALRAEIEARLPDMELLELLGRGGMGYVYRARQKKLDREVALKVLAPGADEQPGFADRFAREAQALARLNHPNIVAVHDYGQEGSFCWLLMEYVHGSSLRDVIRTGRLDPAEALALVPKICEALQYAHDQGVVHRDVKPENILLDREGRVKIADFGLAKLIGTRAALVTLTGSQQVLGTFRYMAPEQLDRPLEVDHRADIYSLGVVFYEMLTGEIPMGRFDPPSLRSEADPRVDDVVLRALEKEPEQRYQRASELKTDVESLAKGERAPLAGTRPPATDDDSAPKLSMHAVVSAGLFGASFIPLLIMIAVILGFADPDDLGEAAEQAPPAAGTTFRGGLVFLILGLIPGVFGLALMIVASALGFRALHEIRRSWPRLYGAGSAVAGAWAGILLVANTAIMAVFFGFWDVPGEVPAEAPRFTALLLLTCDVAFLVWYRRRFLARCRAQFSASS